LQIQLNGAELSEVYDIAVVGSGFAGSLLAMIARRLGRRVVLIERGRHPRVVIGESSTPLSNLLLEDLADRYDLPALKPLAKWGSWQRTYPEVACGLKRGFTFHHHVLGTSTPPDPMRRDQLLVAASPRDEIADTHWYRADVDHFLVREAQRTGVEYVDEVKLVRFVDGDDAVTLEGKRNGREVSFSAKFVVDATGPRGFLHKALGLGELVLPGLPATQALYTHFSEVTRLGDLPSSRTDSREAPPYPIDDAAVHHVFDGGWVWVLRFNNGITSAGVAATDETAARLKFADGGSASWERLLELIPVLQEQFAGAKAERLFTHIPRLGFRSEAVTGCNRGRNNWALLPSAAGFVDPLLSTGFPLTLLGVSRLAEIFGNDWDSDRFATRLQTYATQTDGELLATARLIGTLYKNMGDFSVFVALSLLYFAAASFSEMARRLDRAHLAKSFLLHDDAQFGPECLQLLERAMLTRTEAESAELVDDILRAIESFNVAGLGNPERRNWYPVEADDLLRAAHKVDASREEIMQLLRRCGFADAESTSLAAQRR
jgi:FADH2 O2-dependent halogenase